MKVSRRVLFGVGAGAAIAGPNVVKSALVHGADLGSSAMPAMGSVLSGAVPAFIGDSSGPNKAETPTFLLDQLKRLAIQRDDTVKNTKPYLCVAGDLRIDGLRSVSVASRARMIAEERAKRELANQLSWIDKQIEDVKKQLGILGNFI
jgi:hypothetical protein